MLDDLAVLIEAKDVDARPWAIAGPLLEAMQDNVVALGDRALDMYARAGVFPRHRGEGLDERVRAGGDHGVVLDVSIANEPVDCLGGLALVEHQIVESLRRLLVAPEL